MRRPTSCSFRSRSLRFAVLLVPVAAASAACGRSAPPPQPPDLLLTNGNVYTFAWDEPSLEGVCSARAPRGPNGWKGDAQAIGVRGTRIVFVGSNKDAPAWRAEKTRVIDLHGATVVPGLVDAHVHILELGRPEGGWQPGERMTPEEALRGYTTWAAYAAFLEGETGVLTRGRWADITVMDLDPLDTGEKDPARLLDGKIRMTIVAGRLGL